MPLEKVEKIQADIEKMFSDNPVSSSDAAHIFQYLSGSKFAQIILLLSDLSVKDTLKVLRYRVKCQRHSPFINCVARLLKNQANEQLIALLENLADRADAGECVEIIKMLLKSGQFQKERQTYIETVSAHQGEQASARIKCILEMLKKHRITRLDAFISTKDQATLDRIKRKNNNDYSVVNAFAEYEEKSDLKIRFLTALSDSITSQAVTAESVLELLVETSKDSNFYFMARFAHNNKPVLEALVKLFASLIETNVCLDKLRNAILGRYIGGESVFSKIYSGLDRQNKELLVQMLNRLAGGRLTILQLVKVPGWSVGKAFRKGVPSGLWPTLFTESDAEAYLKAMQAGEPDWQTMRDILLQLEKNNNPLAKNCLLRYRTWEAKQLAAVLAHNPDKEKSSVAELRTLANEHRISEAVKALRDYYREKAIALRQCAVSGNRDALKALTELAKQHAEANCQLGVYYYQTSLSSRFGWLLGEDSPTKAFDCFDKAMQTESATAEYYYAVCKDRGLGTTQDRELAMYHFFCSAQNAVVEAITQLKAIVADDKDPLCILANMYQGCREELVDTAQDFYRSGYWQTAFNDFPGGKARFAQHAADLSVQEKIPLRFRLALLQIANTHGEAQDKVTSFRAIVSLLNKATKEMQNEAFFKVLGQFAAVLDGKVIVDYAAVAAQQKCDFTYDNRLAWLLLAERSGQSDGRIVQLLSAFSSDRQRQLRLKLFREKEQGQSSAQAADLEQEYSDRLEKVGCSLQDLPEDCFDPATHELLVKDPHVSKAGHTYNLSTFESWSGQKDPLNSEVDFVAVVPSHTTIKFIESIVSAKEQAHAKAIASELTPQPSAPPLSITNTSEEDNGDAEDHQQSSSGKVRQTKVVRFAFSGSAAAIPAEESLTSEPVEPDEPEQPALGTSTSVKHPEAAG